jgi:hypothetical protein
MSTFVEGRLEFTFPSPPWNARKWDAEPAYRHGVGRLRDSKAADFVAEQASCLLVMEVKDFRHHRIENKLRLKDNELAIEVAQKVRDTIAGLVGAQHRSQDGDSWISFVAAATDPKRPIHAVLWLEQDAPPKSSAGARAQAHNALQQELKRQLRWLTTRVLVASIDRPLSGISVRNV